MSAFVFSVLIGYIVYPLVNVYWESLSTESGFDAKHWRTFSESAILKNALWNSIKISIYSVIFAGMLGAGFAVLIEQFRFKGRRLLLVAAVLPLTLPPLIGVMAFWRLFGFSGVVTRLLADILQTSPAKLALLDIPGVVLIHSYSFSVYFFLLTRSGLQNLESSVYLAARSLGVSRWRRFVRLTLPAMLPFWISASLLVFMLSMGSYSAPKYMMSGKPYIPVLTVEIAETYFRGNYQLAAVLSSLLSLICLGLLLILQIGLKSAWRQQAGGHKGATQLVSHTIIKNKVWNILYLVISGTVLVIMALPLLSILITSFANIQQWNYQASLLPSSWTIENYSRIFHQTRAYMHPVFVSLIAALLATGVNLILAVLSAYLITRGSKLTRAGVDLCSMLPLSLPGTVVAFNIALTFGNNSSPLTLGISLKETIWILVLLYIVRQIPLAIRPVGASMAQLDETIELASRSLGKGVFSTFFYIVLPQLRAGLAAAAIICFVSGFGEFVGSVLVSSTRWTPVSIEIAAALADTDGLGPASALAAIVMAMSAGSLIIYNLLARRT
jgi:iron(III) transport system permease protein